jgi:ATP-dependent helicase/nuclease subunit A
MAKLATLNEAQRRASDPRRDVWLTASAGTGKTQVLAARVLRLLLNGAHPETILCLTFTKAGASEMAERIHATLGRWVTLDDQALFKDLTALGEKGGPDQRKLARRLFAGMLDARGQGLRIQTIHAFAQSLLGAFPAEAELAPGFRAIDEREAELLHDTARAALIEAANDPARPRPELIAAIGRLALDPGDEALFKMMRRCAATPDTMEAFGSEIGWRVREWMGLGDADIEAMLADGCDEGFDRDCLDVLAAANRQWGTDTGIKAAQCIADWLALEGAERVAAIDTLHAVWATQKGEPKVVKSGLLKAEPQYEMLRDQLFAHFAGLIELRKLAALATRLTDALTVAQAYSGHYAQAKREVGAVDFDDLIREAARLLTTPGMGEWIRYKLDQATDHVLIDEAQDTNARQWDIVKAIAEEFFAGLGTREPDRLRTLFTVGDYKQAIFGFQGTDPQEFKKAREHFEEKVANPETGRELDRPALIQSFRSGPPVLEIVDAVIDEIGVENFGIEEEVKTHISGRGGSGRVVVWPPVRVIDGEHDDETDREEGWLSSAELRFAADLARKVRHWTTGGLYLRNRDRPARPEDVLILVRSRGDLARTIVARLHEEGVPVAGVDRLKLASPIAVQDLIAAIRFALQPEDDLTLAALLVSPLVGWSQDDLMNRAIGRKRSVPLWRHIADARPPELSELLRMADFTTPYRFLEAVLSGPIGGRRKLLARLGEEARDPIEALLDMALTFERDNPPSLQLFCDWLGRGDPEVVRDAGKPEAAVRVMTAHGAKGLQAPIVVLADATRAYRDPPNSGLEWESSIGKVSLFRPRAPDRAGVIAKTHEANAARNLREHWRLLYVALSRAEEHLFIGGALTPKQKIDDKLWHERVSNAMRTLGADEVDGELRYGRDAPPLAPDSARGDDARWNGPLPAWLTQIARPEARPPRPLAPSAILPLDRTADAPPTPEMRAAADQGRILHALFERLPAVAPADRRAAAAQWLKSEGSADPAELIESALAVIEYPDYASFFAPDALAEAPVAGVVAGQVIAGTVDRLVIHDDAVLIAEFKTGRRVPADAASGPEAHVAQIAAYAAVLGGLFPDRRIEAALIYTAGPCLIPVPPEMLAAHKPGYRAAQENLETAG